MTEKVPVKKWKKYLLTASGCIMGIFLLLMLFLIVTGSEPVISAQGIHYDILYFEEGGIALPESPVLIPAVVNESGSLVFSEKDLSDLSKDCYDAGYMRYHCGRFNLSYVNTKNGTMISIRPREKITFDDDGGISILLEKENIVGNRVSFTPADHPLFMPVSNVPFYIPDHGTRGNKTQMSLAVILYDCRYNPQHPGICRGYAVAPQLEDQPSLISRGYISTRVQEFGQYNEFRDRILRPFSIFFGSP
jgi:hypothetical protein